MNLNLFCIKGAQAFVCFTFFSFCLRVLDKADHTQLLVHVKLLYRIVGHRGYRMVILAV